MSITGIAREKLESEHIDSIIAEKRIHAKDKATKENFDKILEGIMVRRPRLERDGKNFGQPQQLPVTQQANPAMPFQQQPQPQMQEQSLQAFVESLDEHAAKALMEMLKKKMEAIKSPVDGPTTPPMAGQQSFGGPNARPF